MCKLAGGDGAQLYVNKQHGTTIWGIRLLDLPPHLSHCNDAWIPLGVVEGPSEPTNMDSILADVLEFFRKHDPGTCLVLVCTLHKLVGSIINLSVDTSYSLRCRQEGGGRRRAFQSRDA